MYTVQDNEGLLVIIGLLTGVVGVAAIACWSEIRYKTIRSIPAIIGFTIAFFVGVTLFVMMAENDVVYKRQSATIISKVTDSDCTKMERSVISYQKVWKCTEFEN